MRMAMSFVGRYLYLKHIGQAVNPAPPSRLALPAYAAPMATGFDRARLKLPPASSATFAAELRHRGQPCRAHRDAAAARRRARAVVVAAFVLILGAVVIHAVRSGSSALVDDLSDSLLPLIAMAASGGAHLRSEAPAGGLRRQRVRSRKGDPRRAGADGIASFSGLALPPDSGAL
jgi:hypothetical protein